MAICDSCNQEMHTADGCTLVRYDGETKDRIPYGSDGWGEPVSRCHDCGAMYGHLHHPGCDVERCANCGGQAITCSCN